MQFKYVTTISYLERWYFITGRVQQRHFGKDLSSDAVNVKAIKAAIVERSFLKWELDVAVWRLSEKKKKF